MYDKYFTATYQDGARGEVVGGRYLLDCWGLVLAIREEVLGLPALPAFGPIDRRDLRSSAKAYAQYAELMPEGPPVPGAIAAVLHGGLCIHVGVVVPIDGELRVFEIDAVAGVDNMRLIDFERSYPRVKYHRDRDLSEQAGRRAC
ncbi:hypothetical protein [Pseudomonas cremoricolorata]|uniref:NlpC/P60 domain-containing protein n=1 Tax=Pseudomonas cremoricolorata TaxID=157783 RepID=A0A089WST3_9PSED|nr:hypothetical protein [Pseudomonas cremoricolorata]AIR90234.1 hypothetical protein LK03_13430 [Pseudomonas cremoricolorata]